MKKQLLLIFLCSFFWQYGQQPLYQFNFDGNLTESVSNTNPLTAAPSAPPFTTDRFGLASKAVDLNGVSASANLANLPTGNAVRSVSFWIKYNDLASTSHDVFCYGTATANQAFGFQQISDFGGSFLSRAVVVGWTGPFNLSHEVATNPNVWYHYVITSEVNPGVGGVLTKIYRDGVLIRQQTNVSRNTIGTNFILGKMIDGTGTINAALDDLRIYNSALTQAQVSTLFTGVTPVITNTNTTAITNTGATVNYTLNALGQNVTRKVYYYDLYGNFTTTPDIVVNNNTPTVYSNVLTGLTPNRRYSYFVTGQVTEYPNVAFASSPTITFTTPGPGAVPSISGVSVGAITATSVSITYTMNPNGPGNATSNIGFQATTTAGSAQGDVASGTTPLQFTEVLTNLAPNTTYTYEVWAQNSAGESIPVTGTFTTAPSTPAPVITNVVATNVTFSAATIGFNLNAFGSATTYVIEYGTDTLGAFQTQNGGTTSVNSATPFQVQLTNLTPNQFYFARVKATNAAGQVVVSANVTFTTPTPIVLTNLNDSNVTATSAQINYTLNTNGFSAFVEIRYQPGTVFDADNPFTTEVITSSVTNTSPTNYSYTLNGLQPNTTYSYEFGAVSFNAGGVETGENAAFTTLGISAQPTAPSPQTFCQNANPTVANLTATGTTLRWYTSPTGGTPLASTTALVSGTYYVSQTQPNSVESTRLAVTVTVNVVNAPTASAQTFCQSGTVANLVATGSTLRWYAATTGGSPLANTVALTSGTYYVSQTVNNCESARTAVAVTVNVVNAPTASAQTFCQSGTVANLVATGSNLQWYAAATGGSPLANTVALASGTYYVSQTVNNCESARTAVAVTVNVVNAPTASAQTFCQSGTVANLVATGSTLRWYAAATGGSPLANTVALTSGTYYVSQTVNNCESARTAVAVTVNVVNAPTGNATQTFVQGATVANLTATGTNVVWFATQADANANTNPLSTTTLLVNNSTYFAVQTVNGCRSAALSVLVTVTLSTQTPEMALSFMIYPNPATDWIRISSEEVIEKVTLYSLQGQKIWETSATEEISIAALPSGVYLLQVQSAEGKTAVRRWIKK